MPSAGDSRPRASSLFYKLLNSFLKFTGGAYLLQRLFSTFPAGTPGAGLFLLRTALSLTIFFRVGGLLNGQSEPTFLVLCAETAALAAGLLILLGFLTPLIAAALSAGGLVGIVSADSLQTCDLPVVYGIVLCVALMLLGPGAFSLDARAFGRREIVIPRN